MHQSLSLVKIKFGQAIQYPVIPIIIRIAQRSRIIFIETGTTVLFACVHCRSSRITFAVTHNFTHKDQRLSGIFRRTNNRFACIIIVLRTNQHPILFTEIIVFKHIISRRYHNDSIISVISSAINISLIEMVEVTSPTTFNTRSHIIIRKNQNILPRIFAIRITEWLIDIIIQLYRSVLSTAITINQMVTIRNTIVPPGSTGPFFGIQI